MSQIFVPVILFCLFSAIYGQTNTTQSECQKARAKALARDTTSQINLVPNCEPNGDYSGLQCHSNSTWCQCWTTNGLPVTQPSRKIKSCTCILHRETVKSGLAPRQIGAYIPQCAPNGGYNQVQSHGSTGHSWCVDVQTGAQVGERVRGNPQCK